MELHFYKYQGTGNDFVMIDNRALAFPKNTNLIQKLCDRRFGIGGDGLILLEQDEATDFRMVYYNSDGNESSMCGNGGRCIVAFAKKLGIFENETNFIAVDGLHFAQIDKDGIVSLQMKDVKDIEINEKFTFLNTGSPHHVQMVNDIQNFPVKKEGSQIRYSDLYGAKGTNVNFVEQLDEQTFRVRTYERGVEDETLSCGTGVTAVAIAMFVTGKTKNDEVNLIVEGGHLNVRFQNENAQFSQIFLTGPATHVFSGVIKI
ncbi:diaminopimelate epimerase [Flavobacterium sp.]|uniref:diaminopimelate epimerase n=1 Tax=Flavobacterium sp. TaxID=239 RepID=UPI002615EABD|nr:diaminopimelate epimerase [Flavobacterium sp.]MDD3004035.1 diaminopimelate epimerase [Flavobacterium sp.]